MERLVAWWVRNPIASNLLMVSVLLAGLLSALRAEREFLPYIPVNYVVISAKWLGASPADMDRIVIQRINEALRDVDDMVSQLSSTSRQGSATVSIEINSSIEMAEAVQRIEQAVSGIPSFPRDMEPLTIMQRSSESSAFGFALFGDVSDVVLYQTALRLRTELAEKPGVPKVELTGNRNPEISIEVDQESLQRYGLSIADVTNAIRGDSVEQSAGRIRASGGTISVAARQLAVTGFAVGNIEIRRTAEHGTVRVKDVAKIVDGFEDINFVARVRGKPAVALEILTSPNMDVIKMSESAQAWIEEVRPTLPAGVELTVWFDTADILRDRINTISDAALGGLLLVLAVLALTLRSVVAFWTAVGIGVAYAGAFAVMSPNDVSINVVSLFGFLLVLGIVIDDAIIVGESIHHQYEKGVRGAKAAIFGAVSVSRPVIFAVLTTMLTFVPWLLLSGPQVQTTRHIAVVAIGALLFSLIEVFCILPMHLRRMREVNKVSKFVRLQESIGNSIVRVGRGPFRRLSIWSVRNRYAVLLAFICIYSLCSALVSNHLVREGFAMDVENELITMQIKTDPGVPFERIQEIAQQVEGSMVRLRGKSESLWGIQVSQDYFTNTSSSGASGFLMLVPPEERNDISAAEIRKKWREELGEVYGVKSIELNSNIANSGPDLEYELVGEDTQVLYAAKDALRAHLATYEGVRDIFDNASYGERELKITLRERGRQLNLTLGDVVRAVRAAYYGQEVQRVQRSDHEVRVMVRYDERTRSSLHSLRVLRLRTPSGAYVPLGEVAEIDFQPGSGDIKRRNRAQVVRVGAQEVDQKNSINREIRNGFLKEIPREFPGVEERVSGSSEALQEFQGELSTLYTLVFLAQFALLAVAFGSYFLPLVVMVAIPFGYAGAVIGHMVFDIPIDMFSYLGIGAAAGVVINDNLVLVDQAQRNRAAGNGHGLAVVRAAALRFRPIMLTSLTTVIGLMPLLLEQSTQAQFLKPAVVSLVFAVGFASAVTLLLVPALFVIGNDFAIRARAMTFKRIRRRPGAIGLN